MNTIVSNDKQEMHRHVGELFEQFFIEMVRRSFDKDTFKINDERKWFADMATPCGVSVELKSRVWTRAYSCVSQSGLIHPKGLNQLRQGLEFASRSGSKYAFIVGIHQFDDNIQSLLNKKNCLADFLACYKSVHVIFGDCGGITYTVYNINNFFRNLNNGSFREKLTDCDLGETRSLDLEVNLGLKLGPNNMILNDKWWLPSNDKWLSDLRPINLSEDSSQDSAMFDTQRLYPFSELMYESVMFEEPTCRHDNSQASYGCRLVYIKNLDVSKETQRVLKAALKDAGFKCDRIFVLDAREVLVALTATHLFELAHHRRKHVPELLTAQGFKYPDKLWQIASRSKQCYQWLRRFHKILESSGVIQNYLLIDPVTLDFKGMPKIEWTHEDHVSAILRYIENGQELPDTKDKIQSVEVEKKANSMHLAEVSKLKTEMKSKDLLYSRVQSKQAQRILEFESEVNELKDQVNELKDQVNERDTVLIELSELVKKRDKQLADLNAANREIPT